MLNYSYRLWGFSKRSSQIESHLVTYAKSSRPLHLNVRNSWCYCLVLFYFVCCFFLMFVYLFVIANVLVFVPGFVLCTYVMADVPIAVMPLL